MEAIGSPGVPLVIDVGRGDDLLVDDDRLLPQRNLKEPANRLHRSLALRIVVTSHRERPSASFSSASFTGVCECYVVKSVFGGLRILGICRK